VAAVDILEVVQPLQVVLVVVAMVAILMLQVQLQEQLIQVAAVEAEAGPEIPISQAVLV
jgi:hypothetical protein